jgi:hypothetical protein
MDRQSCSVQVKNKKRYSWENVMKNVKEEYMISEVQGNCKHIIQSDQKVSVHLMITVQYN